MFPSSSYRISNKTPVQARRASFQSSGERSPRDPLNNIGHCYCSWWLPEKWCNTLLLKSPHMLDTGSGRNYPDLTCKPPHWQLSLIVLKGTMQNANGVKQSLVLHCCNATTVTSRTSCSDRGSSDIYILEVTNLTGLNTGRNSFMSLYF